MTNFSNIICTYIYTEKETQNTKSKQNVSTFFRNKPVDFSTCIENVTKYIWTYTTVKRTSAFTASNSDVITLLTGFGIDMKQHYLLAGPLAVWMSQ